MKARYLKELTLDRLREEVPANLDRYRDGHAFAELLNDRSLFFESKQELNVELLDTLLKPTDNFYEVENCLIVFQGLRDLTPFDARDERIWVYLCHTIGLEYAKARWPIPNDDEKAIQHIRIHFFARNGRAIERDNALSRLWWMAYLCSRVQNMELVDALKVLLYRTDVRAQLIEHPSMSQNVDVFSAIIRTFDWSLANGRVLLERDNNRRFIREMNAVGGYRSLDALTADYIQSIVDDVATTSNIGKAKEAG